MARIGIELHLFEILAGSENTPLSSITLAEKTGVDLVLMSMSSVKVGCLCSLTLQRTFPAMLGVVRYDHGDQGRPI